MNRKAMRTIMAHGMIPHGSTVHVAVSGGADSVALLHILYAVREELDLELRALHLNHGLRGQESRRDEAFVKALCKRLEIPLKAESVRVDKIAARLGISVEEAGRRARYAFFRRAASGDIVATAHTATDNVETVLLNLARGTALRGLCGIPPVRSSGDVTIIRPLLECSREDVEEFCHRYRIDYVTDSTNLQDDFTRNKIRHRVLPVLRELNPRLEQTVTRMTEAISTDDRYLDEQAEHDLNRMRITEQSLDRRVFLSLAPALRMRTLRKLLSERRISCSRARLMRLEQLIVTGSGAVQLSDHLVCRCAGAAFYLEEPARNFNKSERGSIRLQIPRPGETCQAVLDNRILRLRVVDWAKDKKNMKNSAKPLKNALDCDRINQTPMLRYRQPGDAIRLAGRGCTKNVRKLFSEAKIPQGERSSRMLLSDDSGVLWLEGFGVREDVAVHDSTRLALILETGG